MVPYFPRWARITVAEVEAADRRLTFEELIVLAALFSVPVIEILLPTEDLFLELPVDGLLPEDFAEMLIGHGGTIGTSGPDWAVAMQITPNPTPRPAPDYWTRLSGREHEDRTSRNRN
jgi:hypothetical protein